LTKGIKWDRILIIDKMKILLKKEKPIKSYKSSFMDSMIARCSFGLVLILGFIFIISIFSGLDINISDKIFYVIFLVLPLVFVFYFFYMEI
jgi:hypothetical protein